MYKLSNNTIFGNEKVLFISNGDHNLIEIVGDDVLQVEQVIKGFRHQTSPDTLYNQIKHFLNNDKEYFDDICQWLINNKIIEEVESLSDKLLEVPTYVLGTPHDNSETVFHILKEPIESHQYHFTKEADFEKAQLILIISPIFENSSEVLRLNEFAYIKKIPICYVGFDSSPIFSIGPLVYSELNTPCLNCYIKRKLTNLQKPQKTISFVKHPNKQLIAQSNHLKNIYSKIALYHLRAELEKFFRSKRRISAMLGNSLIFDNNTYNFTKAKVLKVTTCSICNSVQTTSPFNV